MSNQSNKYVRILFNMFGAFPSETTPSSHPFWGLSHELWTSLGVPANIPVTSPSSSATRRHECPQRRSSSEPDRGGAANLRQGDLLAWCLVIVTMWCPSLLAKLVNITPITMVYGTQITIVIGAYKPTYN